MYLMNHTTRRDNIIEERRIKRFNDRAIHKFINSPHKIAPP
jgi:hypothetical protein